MWFLAAICSFGEWLKLIDEPAHLHVHFPTDQVFVNPKSGKGNGRKIWGVVAPIFSRAKVSAEVCAMAYLIEKNHFLKYL